MTGTFSSRTDRARKSTQHLGDRSSSGKNPGTIERRTLTPDLKNIVSHRFWIWLYLILVWYLDIHILSIVMPLATVT